MSAAVKACGAAIVRAKHAVMVEGYFDVAQALQAGIASVPDIHRSRLSTARERDACGSVLTIAESTTDKLVVIGLQDVNRWQDVRRQCSSDVLRSERSA